MRSAKPFWKVVAALALLGWVAPGVCAQAQRPAKAPAKKAAPSKAVQAGGEAPRQLTEENFQFRTPRRVTRLDVSAKLMYRKVDQFLLNFLFGESSGITSPVTVLSEDQKSITVVAGRSR